MILEALPRRVVEDIGQATRVIQELADGDFRAEALHRGQEGVDRVVESDRALFDQLEDGRSHVRLGDASNDHGAVWRKLGASVAVPPAAAGPHQLASAHDREGDAVCAGRGTRRLERGLIPGRLGDLDRRRNRRDGPRGTPIQFRRHGQVRHLREEDLVDRPRCEMRLDSLERRERQVGRKQDQQREQEPDEGRTGHTSGPGVRRPSHPPPGDRSGLSDWTVRGDIMAHPGRAVRPLSYCPGACGGARYLLA
jgi:hypothetical protein